MNNNEEVGRVRVEKVESMVDGLEIVDNFCYLGDMIQRDGGCDGAGRDRVKKGWSKV